MGMTVGGAPHDDGDDYKPLAEINVTPFVDVMLVLLIVFMVAAPLMVQGVPVELPKTSAAKLASAQKPKVVSLAADGLLYVRDEQVSRDRLVSRLLEIKAAEGSEGIVYVRADRSIAYGEVMEILGRVGQAGFARVSLLSQPSPAAQAATTKAPPQSQ